MKITLAEYRPFDINKLTETTYTAVLFGNPCIVTRMSEDGDEVIEHEVDVYHSEILPVTSLQEAEEYVSGNFYKLLSELVMESDYRDRLKRKEEAELYLSSTDYRTLKAVRELPEVRSKLEELYPGELERNRVAAKDVRFTAR